IQLQYEIKGALQVLCDRSLEMFDYPIAINPKIILKFGDHDEELSEELYLIDRNSQQINIAQHLFEFISLEIPMKKLHPRFLENTEDEEVEIIDNHEGIIVYSTITKDEKEQANSDQEKPIDPRWAALANLK
ncbi:MAG: DUF177 domain-containing protein, partial [Pseudarcicella sp.]|nr:DUF177 domain-containing protein [Pseudarcicella sp.]